MTVVSDQAIANHLGYVVRDLDATAALYQRLLGVPRWHRVESPGRFRVAIGRAAGATFELIEPVAGSQTVHAAFLERRGEGIQHLGFWVADPLAAVRVAVQAGAVVTVATLEGGVASVHLMPGQATPELLARMQPDKQAYVDPGAGGVQWEFCGPALEAQFRERMAEDFPNVLVAPPWTKA